MDTAFQKILDDIRKSTKAVNVLPSDYSIKAILKKTYKINTKSLLATLFENTGELL